MNPYEAPQSVPVLDTDDWNVISGFAWGVLCTVAVIDLLRWLWDGGWI